MEMLQKQNDKCIGKNHRFTVSKDEYRKRKMTQMLLDIYVDMGGTKDILLVL